MEFLNGVLPIIIYILLIGLLIIGIIIGIKLIITMNKVEKIVNNVEGKVNSLNGLFNIIEIRQLLAIEYEIHTNKHIETKEEMIIKMKEIYEEMI